MRTISVTNLLHHKLQQLRTLSLMNLVQYEHLHTNLCVRTLSHTNPFRYELQHTNLLHTNYVFPLRALSIRTLSYTNLFRYEVWPLRTLCIMSLILYEPLLTNVRLRTFFYTNLVFMNLRPVTLPFGYSQVGDIRSRPSL